jgi:magnesium transporter
MIAVYPEGALGEAVWIDLFDPSPEEMQKVHDATRLRVPTLQQVSEIESSSRLVFEQGAFYLSTPLIGHRADGEIELSPVGFVLSERVLLTVRFADSIPFEQARAACAKGGDQRAEETFLRILETVVDRAADGLEHAGAECDHLSLAVFRGPDGPADGGVRLALRKIGYLSNKASHIRDELLGIARIATFVDKSDFQGAPQVNPARMKAVRADIASLADYETRLSSKVQFALDATLGYINIDQNEIVKTLTIASVVGIPPVLIAGIYGMNFRVMPELNWAFGYPMALGLIVVSAVIPIVWFKKRRWM